MSDSQAKIEVVQDEFLAGLFAEISPSIRENLKCGDKLTGEKIPTRAAAIQNNILVKDLYPDFVACCLYQLVLFLKEKQMLTASNFGFSRSAISHGNALKLLVENLNPNEYGSFVLIDSKTYRIAKIAEKFIQDFLASGPASVLVSPMKKAVAKLQDKMYRYAISEIEKVVENLPEHIGKHTFNEESAKVHELSKMFSLPKDNDYLSMFNEYTNVHNQKLLWLKKDTAANSDSDGESELNERMDDDASYATTDSDNSDEEERDIVFVPAVTQSITVRAAMEEAVLRKLKMITEKCLHSLSKDVAADLGIKWDGKGMLTIDDVYGIKPSLRNDLHHSKQRATLLEQLTEISYMHQILHKESNDPQVTAAYRIKKFEESVIASSSILYKEKGSAIYTFLKDVMVVLLTLPMLLVGVRPSAVRSALFSKSTEAFVERTRSTIDSSKVLINKPY